MSGKIKLDEFITHKMNLEEVNDAINLMKTGEWYISYLFLHFKLTLSESSNIFSYLTAFDAF